MISSSTIILVRHGSVTRVSDQGTQLLYGPNEPLNQTGVKQIESLGKTLNAKIIPSLIYSSPTLRARQSAELLQKSLRDHPPIVDSHEFRATDAPQWRDRPIRELIAAGGDIFAPNPNAPDKNGETIQEAYNRVVPTFESIRKQHTNDTIVIVTHGEIISMIQNHLRMGENSAPGMDATIDKGESLLLRWNNKGEIIDSRVISPEGQPSHREKEQ